MDIPDTDIKFYMGFYGANKDFFIPWIRRKQIPIMGNASHYYRDTKGFRNIENWKTDVFVDSGGYNVQVNYGHYPWNVEDYNDWLNENSDKFEWAAVMDYACEHRFDEIHSKEERMQKTLENTIKQYDLDRDYNLMPVLQGRTPRDYIEFVDRLNDHGIPVEYVGLGTVCRISSSRRIIKTERKIRSRTNVKNIHGFGVKIDAFKMGATFDSADSAAWLRLPSYGMYAKLENGKLERYHHDNPKLRGLWTFKSYYKYVKSIIKEQEQIRNNSSSAMEW